MQKIKRLKIGVIKNVFHLSLYISLIDFQSQKYSEDSLNRIIVFESPMLAHFADLTLCLVTKHNNLLGSCSILDEKLTNFDPPKQKLNNPTDLSGKFPARVVGLVHIEYKLAWCRVGCGSCHAYPLTPQLLQVCINVTA